MYNLLWKQVILFAILSLGLCQKIFSQKDIFRQESEDRPYFFGVTLGINNSFFGAKKSSTFLSSDTILMADPGTNRGLALGLHATGRISPHLQVRFNPQLILGGSRYFNYTLKYSLLNEPLQNEMVLPTTLLSFPVQMKFSSDRINNFKTYLLFGAFYNIDLSANSALRKQENYIQLKPNDFGLETGIGFNIFMRYFTLSPELKISYGLNNILNRDLSNKYSHVFSSIYSRMIMLSFHFEQ